MLYFLSVDQWHRTAAWLYGSGLTALFITSTLFHTAAWKISHLRCVCVCVYAGARGREEFATRACLSSTLIDSVCEIQHGLKAKAHVARLRQQSDYLIMNRTKRAKQRFFDSVNIINGDGW